MPLFTPLEDKKIRSLMAMGFERDHALVTLIQCAWSFDSAVDTLIDSPEPEPDESESRVAPAALEPVRKRDLRYVVLRMPTHLQHMRGHHKCDLQALRARLGADPWGPDRSGIHIRLFRDQQTTDELWVKQRLALPVPDHK